MAENTNEDVVQDENVQDIDTNESQSEEPVNEEPANETVVPEDDNTSDTDSSSDSGEGSNTEEETDAAQEYYNSDEGQQQYNPYGETALEAGNEGSFLENLWDTVSNGTHDLGGVLDYGLTTGGEMIVGSLLASKITKHPTLGKVIGIGGVLALQNMEMLPTSFEPIKDWIQKMGDPDYAEKQAAQRQADDEKTNSPVAETEESLSRMVDVNDGVNQGVVAVYDGLGKAGSTDISEVMYNNGLAVSSNNGFIAIAGLSDNSLSGLRYVASDNMSVLSGRVADMCDETGLLDDFSKDDVVNELKQLGEGYASYSHGAMAGISDQYREGSDEYLVSVYGLDKVMQQETLPYYQLLHELDDQYDLFTDEDIAYFDSLGIEGVPSYSEYNDGVSMSSATIELPEVSEEDENAVEESAEPDGESAEPAPVVEPSAADVAQAEATVAQLTSEGQIVEIDSEDDFYIMQGFDFVNSEITPVVSDIGNGVATDGAKLGDDMYMAGQILVANDTIDYVEQYDDATLLVAYGDFCSEPMKSLVSNAQHLSNENGELSADAKAYLVDELKTLGAGYQAYSDGVLDAIEAKNGENGAIVEARQQYFGKMMRQEMGPFYQAMYSLDKQYGLFTEEDKAYFDSLECYGMPSYSSYDDYMDSLAQPENAVKEGEGVEANAEGQTDEKGDAQQTSEEVTEEIPTEDKNASRVAMAEDMKSRVVKDSPMSDYGMSYNC